MGYVVIANLGGMLPYPSRDECKDDLKKRRKKKCQLGRKTHLGFNKEVFDTELYAIGTALQVTREISTRWKARRVRKVVLFTDAQAALGRIQHSRVCAGQAMALRAIRLDEHLHELGLQIEY